MTPRKLRHRSILLVFLAVLLASPAAALAARPESVPLAPLRQPAGAGLGVPCVDLVEAIDNSGSEQDSDPHGLRLAAGSYLLDMLSRLSTRGLAHRAGVVLSGSTAPAMSPAGLVTL